ncbi:MFS transporter [Streptomyces seoulensis]|uniref:MFS transporter n=1 Tax=Streptomyces seoulensis TaxID=73044 RepID=UPI001FD5D879|nr:MFS transporter [Streptomyces seoulensis]
MAPLTGRFADRFDSRRLIVTVASLQILACLAMTQTTTPALLIVLAVLLSTGLAFTHPVFAGLPAAMVGKDNIPRASAISQTTAMAAWSSPRASPVSSPPTSASVSPCSWTPPPSPWSSPAP